MRYNGINMNNVLLCVTANPNLQNDLYDSDIPEVACAWTCMSQCGHVYLAAPLIWMAQVQFCNSYAYLCLNGCKQMEHIASLTRNTPQDRCGVSPWRSIIYTGNSDICILYRVGSLYLKTDSKHVVRAAKNTIYWYTNIHLQRWTKKVLKKRVWNLDITGKTQTQYESWGCTTINILQYLSVSYSESTYYPPFPSHQWQDSRPDPWSNATSKIRPWKM